MDRNKILWRRVSLPAPPLEVPVHLVQRACPDESMARQGLDGVDLIPKFLMANGQLVKLLVHRSNSGLGSSSLLRAM